jgi:serine/threonine-protein kinase
MSPLYRRVGTYEIRAEIGSGGMADVYVADDSRTGSRVALKIPRKDPDIRRAERDGALLQQHLAERDPRVARVYEIGEDDGVAYVAMEYVTGQDLSEWIARGPLDPTEAIRIGIELCDLLATAHACTPPVGEGTKRGIVHGDLKPRNIRIEPGGRVCVVDFGIAKALSETRRLTRNEFGSLSYSSPERVSTGNVDAHSDLWATAVVLYEMLAGRPPFRADNPRQLEEKILAGARLEPLPAPCSRALAAVLQKALAPELEQRYAGAAMLRADLEAAREGGITMAEHEAAAVVANGAGAGAAMDDATRRTPIDEATRRAVSPVATVAAQVADATRRTLTATPADEATRRTGAASSVAPADEATRRAGDANGATRRTVASTLPQLVVPPGSAPPASQPGAPPPTSGSSTLSAVPAPGPTAGRRRRLVSMLKRVAALVVIALIVNEFFVMSAAGDLESSLPSYGRTDAPQVWARYQRLRQRSLLWVGTWRVSRSVKSWHVSGADDLTSDYLSDTPTIRERGWLQAAALLRRAASIAPGDAGVRARLRYVEGQLARIDAEARLERNVVDARARFNIARRAFEDAVRLRSHWPDPHLGLARVFTVGFADVDKTQDELHLAEQADYSLGNREIALVADAHRLRAERTWRAVPGLPEEEHYLERIRSDCRRALELYDEVPAYREVSQSIRRTHALLDQVETRLDEIRRQKGFLERLGDAARDLVTPAGSQ